MGEEGSREEEVEEEEEKEEEEEECQTPFQGGEVILSLVESSVLVDRPFFFLILLSNRGMKIEFSLCQE